MIDAICKACDKQQSIRFVCFLEKKHSANTQRWDVGCKTAMSLGPGHHLDPGGGWGAGGGEVDSTPAQSKHQGL